MTCDETCTHVLREIGGEGDLHAEARAHLSRCAPCSEYRREAERVWQVSGRATETCPPRRNLLAPGRPGRATSPVAAAAAALIVAASLVAWALRPAGQATTARQEPDANAEELLRKDPELRKQVLRTAVQEKERLVEFEKKLAEAEKGFEDAKALNAAGKVGDAVKRAEDVLIAFPKLKLVVLDPYELKHRSSLLWNRVRELVLTGQLALLREKPDPNDAATAERAATEIRLVNTLREVKRQLEVLALRGPQPRKETATELGDKDPTLRNDTLDKIRSIRITIDFENGSMKDIAAYLREISGLNMVLEGAGEQQGTKLSLKLSDVTMEALLDHLTRNAGYTWEVDRFGILFFKTTKK
jgi:hypothetical protein